MKYLISLFALCFSFGAFAQTLKLDGGFTSNMVIQRNKTVRIFGQAPKNTNVTVKFAGQKSTVKSDDNGRFLATLKPLKASAKGQALTVTDGNEKVQLQNVLIGDVWLCGGQSNMEFNMGPVWRGGGTNKAMKPGRGENIQQQELDIAKTNGKSARPLIRAIVIEKDLKHDSLPTTGWKEIDGESIIPVSAVAYFFGKNMSDSLKVPVGLIVSCWGGTRIETWMNPDYTNNDPTVNKMISKDADGNATKLDGDAYGNRFNHMIRELAPMAMQGIIWYQGESNLMARNWESYNKKEVSLVNGWKQAFQDDALGFYYVQLAPYTYSPRRDKMYANTWRDLADFRPLQILPQDKFPLSGMACTIDLCDNVNDIHPTYKWEVGRRLALQALNKQFDRKDIICDGPRCINTEVKDKSIICTFDQELTTNDGKAPVGFTMSNGGNWANAEAVIEGNKVILTSKKLKRNPVRAHYAWDEVIVTNLCNKQGLPAMPF